MKVFVAGASGTIGQPLIAELIEEDDDRSSLTYVRPSSLMVVEPNEPLLAAAKELDAKLQALAAKVTMA